MAPQQNQPAMFATDVRDPFSFGSWVGQLLLAYLLPEVLLLALLNFMEGLLNPGWLNWVSNGTAAIGTAVIALILGWMVNRLFRRAWVCGRWVWTLPVSVFLLAFTFESLGSSSREAVMVFLAPGTVGDIGWCFTLLTIPTVGTAAYSLAAQIMSRNSRKSGA